MNRENLKLIADHILTINQEMFNMIQFRLGSDPEKFNTIECNSVGCVLGHSVVLDPNPQDIPRDGYGRIQFSIWSERFTGLEAGSDEWRWCFSGAWPDADNTIEGASKRIYWLLDHGLPENWYGQMAGISTLCYN